MQEQQKSLLSTRFDFKNEEAKIYEEWEPYFAPQAGGASRGKSNFCIVLPPPNANADLHLGHAMYVIEDIMIRWHRMKGDATLWLPGADHAGFETQFVYEKHLAKAGKSRFDFDRETLFKDIWDFVQKNRVIMENQLKRLGFSLDWTRKKFTLDPEIQKIVYQTFKKMYDEGLIYRGERLVNYCTKDGTSFSDLEVVHEEVEGKLYYVRYQISNSKFQNPNYVIVATTRPETMFGDVAIAVNPEDKRYKNLISQKVKVPFTNREIPIIADEHARQEFGTGAVKITPSHDENDFEVGKRHNLQGIQVINFYGKLNENAPLEFQKLNVLAAREKIVEELQKNQMLDKIENHKMTVGKCYKCGRVLEPLPLPQWFVKVKPLVEPAIKAIENNEINFYPAFQKEKALEWLNNFHDWNISRQIVWGMQIPAWSCQKCQNWIITDGEKPKECPTCKSADLEQDKDTFDTWFSSGQWSFAALKGESINADNSGDAKASDSHGLQKDDFSRFYPTSVMETGYEILPWWVCRMLFIGIYVTGKIPFKNVYLHGLVRDSKGQKMSKSKGNVVNPLEMIDKYGADALRAAMIFGIGQGVDAAFSEDKVRAMRNFVTKIWNIARFIISEFEKNKEKDIPFYDNKINLQNPDDKSVITELNNILTDVNVSMENYEFTRVYALIYGFVWHNFADIYIEKIKPRLKNNDQECLIVARHVFLNCLKILHPFMPFVTEKIWSLMPRKYNEMLIVSKWPETKQK